MSFNLLRNARVFFTTNVNAGTGVIQATGFTTSNAFEIQVLDDLSFSQNTSSETVTLTEGGAVPVRGQRSFNTALEPADVSFTTYMRPADGGTNITAEESVLWNALFAVDAIGGSAPAWSEDTTHATCVATNSQVHQLQKFGLIVILDSASYAIDNCALDTATIDFGLDAIASIQWNAKAARLRDLGAVTATTGGTVTFGGTLTGSAKGKNTTAPYIANKLTTLTVTEGINGTGTAYTVPITGGSITISNNITYLTPANLGVVNKPFTYFTGTRSISGSLNAYLRTGATNTAGLLSDMLTSSDSDVDPAFYIEVQVGGGTNATRVELEMPAAVLSIPTVSSEQVFSTTINFTAQGEDTGVFDLEEANELEVRYYTTNA